MVRTDLLKCRGDRNVAFLCFLLFFGFVFNLNANNSEESILALACNDLVQVSLDANCEAVITPDMVLEGEESIPGYDPNNYTVTVNGQTGPSVLITEIGVYPVVINEIPTGNSCWGNLNVEDKLPPVADCDCPEGGEATSEFSGSITDGADPQVVTCGDLANEIAGGFANYTSHNFISEAGLASFNLDFTMHTIGCNSVAAVYDGFDPDLPCENQLAFGAAGASIPVTNLPPGSYQLVIFTDPATPVCNYTISSTTTLNEYAPECIFNCTDLDGILDGTIDVPEPTVVELCSGLTMTFSDSVEPSDCAASRIIRTYNFVDGSGNEASCTMEFYLENISIDDITPPEPSFELNCKQAYEPQDIYDYFIFIGETEADANMYAWPTIDGVALKGALCGLGVAKEDQKIPVCPGEYKILRTWTVIDWCTGDIETYQQIIKLTAPELTVTCPTDGAIGFTNHYGCVGDIVLDPPITNADKLCSNVRYTVGYLTSTDGVTPPENGAYIPVGYYEDIEDPILVSGLPLGKNWIRYKVEDECGRVEYCFTEVIIHDNVPPNPVCDEFTVVSLTSLGWAKVFAESFDDGSFDNCSDINFYVRRMDDGCTDQAHYPEVAYEHYDNDYYEWVPFCCDDIDMQVMVEMIVVDNAKDHNYIFVENPDYPQTSDDPIICVPDPDGKDNVNFCMVEVNVQDKSHPQIFCPEDTEIECVDDKDDLSLTGEAEVIGICGPGIALYTDNLNNLDECGFGFIIRTWYPEGFPDYSCPQIITIRKDDDIDISFPADQDVDCMTLPGPEQPWWSGDECRLIGWSVESDTFHVEDGACAKILNHYTVIDWCTYDSNDPIHPDYDGVWTGTQIIKVFDDEAPVVDCEDEMFEADDFWDADNDDNFCETDGVTLTATATDLGACPSNWLKWEIQIDLWDDGSIDYIFSSFAPHNSPNYFAPTKSGDEAVININDDIDGSMHNHKVYWDVTDGCGNNGSCTSSFMVVDKKPPTPYCINLSTALMENGEVELWACDFDLGSFDNCSDHLSFTFLGPDDIDSPEEDPNFDDDIYCSSRIFDCDDLPETYGDPIEVSVYVWDEKNNVDFCVVYLTLVDNNNGCDTVTDGGEDEDEIARIAGQVYTEEGFEVADVEVTNTSEATELTETDKTDASGQYAFEENPMYVNYAVDATKVDSYLNGVSTLDLVLIQKHILGLEALPSGYKVVAADANNDEKITAVDLIELRKLILGVYSELPNNNSWRFISAQQTLNFSQPWPLIETNSINPLNGDMDNENFVAVKVGDVNGNAEANATQQFAEIRSSKTLDLVVVPTKTGIAVKAGSNFTDISGYQFTMKTEGDLNAINTHIFNMTENNFGVLDNGIITTSFVATDNMTLNAGEALFTLEGVTELTLGQSVTKAEAYTGVNNEIINVSLRDGLEALSYSLAQNEPNPFSETTTINFTLAKEGAVILTVYDLTGKVLKLVSGSYAKGAHSVSLTKSELQTSGVLYYTLESGNFTDTKKMILVK